MFAFKKATSFALKTATWFAPEDTVPSIAGDHFVNHQNNLSNIHRIFKPLKMECVSSSLSSPSPHCTQLGFMLLHRIVNACVQCLPKTNTRTHSILGDLSMFPWEWWTEATVQRLLPLKGYGNQTANWMGSAFLCLCQCHSATTCIFSLNIQRKKNAFTMATLNWETIENCWFDSIIKHTELFWTRNNSTNFCFNLV